jgi:peroxiredoxin
VRVGEKALALQCRKLAAHRRGPTVDVGAFGDQCRADRLAGLEVGLDDEPKDALLALAEHPLILESARMADLETLPADLPVPRDDGACEHLPGCVLPPLELKASDGERVRLGGLPGRTVVYAYPHAGRPGEPFLAEDWDLIPGARGCTPESCSFRDHHAELEQAGAGVFGLSTQGPDEQREVAERLGLPFAILSDQGLELTESLRLPTFEVAGRPLLKRFTLLVRDGTIEHVFYPVFPPDRHAAEVLAWLRAHPT